MSILIAVLSFIVAISVLVAIHEFGHFWVARKLGFKVLRFSIGFGKPLIKRVGRDGVEYVVAAIPLGGYVKMLDEREGPVPKEELPRSFTRRPVWQRLLVLAAGPVFNFLFAIAAYWVLFMWGVPEAKPLVGNVAAESYAAEAGLQSGDEILEVEGQRTASAKEVVLALIENVVEDDPVDLTVRSQEGGERSMALRIDSAEERHRLTEPNNLLTGLGFKFDLGPVYAVVAKVVPGGAAAEAGLKAGDRVLAADGKPIGNALVLVEHLRNRPGERVVLSVQRQGEDQGVDNRNERNVAVNVRAEQDRGRTVGRIGIGLGDVPREGVKRQLLQFGPLAALSRATHETWRMSTLTVNMLWNMVIGRVSVKNISGPINIAAFAGESAQIGLQPFLMFLAVVSVSLGILNLLPIPILDGGQMVYQLVEAVKGSPLSEQAQIVGQQIGIALLVILMSLAFYNDISSRFFN